MPARRASLTSLPVGRSDAWKESRSAQSSDPNGAARVVGGEGAAVMGAAAVISSQELRGTVCSQSLAAFSDALFSSAAGGAFDDRFDRESRIELPFSCFQGKPCKH